MQYKEASQYNIYLNKYKFNKPTYEELKIKQILYIERHFKMCRTYPNAMSLKPRSDDAIVGQKA